MTWNFSNCLSYTFAFIFTCFLAVHFAYMKSPTQNRIIASFKADTHPWYDASFKL